MVLTSQTPRQTNRWRHMTNERQRRRTWSRTLLVVGAMALVLAGLWAIFLRGDDGSSGREDGAALGRADGNLDAAQGDDEHATEPLGRGADSPPAGGRDGGVLEMGGGTPLPERAANGSSAQAGGQSGAGLSGSLSGSLGGGVGGVGGAGPQRPIEPPAPEPAMPVAPPKADPPARRETPTPEPLAAAMALGARDPVAARRQLTALVADARLSSAERAKAREAATEINRRILFSPSIVPGDPFAKGYVVQGGDSLQKIARSQGLATDWRFLKRINGLADERKLKQGQTLKLVPGVFSAVVHKADFRMDVFLEHGGERTFVCALPVGLGEHNSTPRGRFKVRPQSKLVNPAWTNPRTGEHYKADDPRNPIGEFWIGIRGIDKANEGALAYGIHGTTEPDSIGREASMGCVRLLAADVALVYELLTEPDSIIEIR